jgi:hypothetical protein
MKKLTIILAIISVVAALESCNALNETPNGNLTIKQVFSKNNTTLSYLNTIYSYIPPYGNKYPFHATLATLTNLFYNAEWAIGATPPAWYAGDLSPTDNPLDRGENAYFYSHWWEGIHKANIFLAHIDNASLDKFHQKNRARYKAEARVLRAYFYLHLIQESGPMPIITKNLPPTFDYKTLTRPSFDKDVQFIVNQCDSAIANPDLPWRITDVSKAQRFTKAVAYAIESEATLWNASPLWNPQNETSKWKQAADVSQKALQALLANGYALYPNYAEYFQRGADYNDNPSDRETILEIPTAKAFTFFYFANRMPIAGLPHAEAGTCPTQELVDMYDMQSTGEPPILGYKDADHLQPIINTSSGYDPAHPYQDRDPRFYATVWYNQAEFPNIMGQAFYKLQIYEGGAQEIQTSGNDFLHTPTGYYDRKYLKASNRKLTGVATWKEYRLAEIYLNYAEAANEAFGPTTDVYNAIKAIRARVNMPPLPSGLTKKEMRKRIRNERNVELAFEGHHFWDIRRWKILGKVGKIVTGMRWTKNPDGSFTGKRFVVAHKHAWEPKYLIMPIPQNEMNKLGPGFKQNPGW